MSPEQQRFLRLHMAEPAPHHWQWQGVDWGSRDRRSGRLFAWRFTGADRRRKQQASVSAEGLKQLHDLGAMSLEFQVTDLGRAMLETVGQ